MANKGERLIEGLAHGAADIYGLVADLTDHLEPRVTEVHSFGDLGQKLNRQGWKEIGIGPFSGSMVVQGSRVERTLQEIRESQERSPIIKARYAVRYRVGNILREIGI